MKKVTTNQLRHSIAFEFPVLSVDEHGQPIRDWVEVESDIPAKLEVKNQNRIILGDAINAELSYVFTIRYRNDRYLDSMRIRHEDEYYSIESLADITGLKKYLEIKTKRTSNPGEVI